jgi:hypothetical protein
MHGRNNRPKLLEVLSAKSSRLSRLIFAGPLDVIDDENLYRTFCDSNLNPSLLLNRSED